MKTEELPDPRETAGEVAAPAEENDSASQAPKTGNKPLTEPMPEEEAGEDANLDDAE